MSQTSLPRLAITMGDPAGVGPEIIAKALSNPEVFQLCQPIVVGNKGVMTKAEVLVGKALEPYKIINFDNVKDHDWGIVRADFGRAAADYIEHATQLALAKKVAGMVTAPIHKEALRMAGVTFPGHTEMIANLCGTKNYGMMLVGPSFRVIHVSTHVSLAEAIRRVQTERIFNTIQLAHHALLREGLDKPRIAVAGLNPHAGEGGLFGDEEEKFIRPAISHAQNEGINASGPHPPDTVFWHASKGHFDLLVAMYHDQGHIPAKLAAFDKSVNVTVGLPIIRSSVDHGTAFDIAGTGQASESSLLEAIRYAARIAREN